MIQIVKHNELARKEYHILPAILMDAIDEGLERGKILGLAEGKSLGLAEGSRQAKFETAKLMLQRKYPQTEICLMTGLSKEEVERL